MSQEINHTLQLAGAFLLLFGLGELLYHRFAVKVELTRKLVHFGTGILTLFFPFFIHNHWLVLFLCASFLIILAVSAAFNWLPSINAVDRVSYGSMAYPVSVYGCYLIYNYYNNNLVFFYLPILVLAISDPAAALIGKKFPVGKFKAGKGKDMKTLVGTAVFFISSFILSLVILRYCSYMPSNTIVTASLTIAATGAVVEAISSKGLDNLTIPVAVIAVLILFT